MPHRGNLTLNGQDFIQSQGLKVPLQCSCELALQYKKCTSVRPLLTEEERDQTKSTNWTPSLFHHEDGPMGLTSEELLEVQNDPLRVGQAASLCLN